MSGFANALRAFQADRLTRDQLLAEVYRALAVERTSPVQLRVELGEANLREELSPDLRSAILERLASWDQTVTSPAAQRSAVLAAMAQPPTIVLGERANNADALDTGGHSSRPSAVTVGATLQDRFRLIAPIGQGGMSRVFKAIDLRRVEAGLPDPHVAVKVLTVPFSHFYGSMAALQDETSKLQQLTHPNIVRVMDCDRDGQTVFMTMEMLEGQSLYAKLQSTPAGMIDRGEANVIVTSVANALDFAHGRHIVHGDLKPGNVIVTESGEVKVIDFGMARFVAGGRQSDPDKPAAMTPRYSSPQLLEGQTPVPADDVYALACLAHEIFTGKHPFAQDGDGGVRSNQLHLERSAALDARQMKAIAHALAYDRDNRTPSVRQFMQEFSALPKRDATSGLGWIAAALIAAIALGYYFLRPQLQPVRVAPGAAPSHAVTTAPGTAFRDCLSCPLMVVVPSGRFSQGAAAGDARGQPFERPLHPVVIASAFAIGQNEVTVAEYKQFADATSAPAGGGCHVYDGAWTAKADADWRNPGYDTVVKDPVSCVSWQDANAYAKWLSETTGKKYRLPSASEWEYAAGAGTSAASPWQTDAEACSYANVPDQSAAARYPGWTAFACSDSFVTVAPVGSFKPNAFGLNDMLGNVFEWTADCWHDNYSGAPSDGSAWVGGECAERELRGGSWFTSPAYLRIAYRNRFEPAYRSSSVGFRIVREVSP